MATQDIMPSIASLGGHNQISTARLGALSTSNTADTSFRQGEVLLLDAAAGDVNVIADGVEAVTTNHFIAAVSSEGVLLRYGLTSGAATHDALVQMYPLTGPDASAFTTQYVVTGSDTQLTSAEKDAILVGDTVGLWRDNTATGIALNGENGRFSVDTGSTGLKVLAKLDANFNDVALSGDTGTIYFVVGTNA